jgi:hypothetical protein
MEIAEIGKTLYFMIKHTIVRGESIPFHPEMTSETYIANVTRRASDFERRSAAFQISLLIRKPSIAQRRTPFEKAPVGTSLGRRFSQS